MKTRIVYPRLWLDEKFAACSVATKLLFCYLINNPHLGLSPYLHITDRQIMFDTGLSSEQLRKGKEELSGIRWCFFAENWVYHHHQAAYIDYVGRDRVMQSKEHEVDAVPTRIKEVFKGLITGSKNAVVEPKVKGLITPFKPVLNKKPETINHKERGVGETKPEASMTYLLRVPPADLEHFGREFNLAAEAIAQKGRDLHSWCEAKGTTKKNYKAFLRLALSKDANHLRQEHGPFKAQPVLEHIDPLYREILGIGGQHD